MLDETFIEMEQAAKSLDLSDVNTAAIQLRKALEGHVKMAAPGPSPPPNATGTLAELAKSINALEVKEFSVAALCAEKAAATLDGILPENIGAAVLGYGRAIRTQDFSTAASYVRQIIRHFQPELTTPAPAEAPNVTPLDAAPLSTISFDDEVVTRG